MSLEEVPLFYWTILFVVAVIFGILGFIYGKASPSSSNESSEDIQMLEIANAQLKSDLMACQQKLPSKEKQEDHFKTENVAALGTQATFDPKRAKAAFGKNIKENDLKLVEGIGPKIEGLFHNFDIKTWEKLSETSADTCQKVLDSGGKRYRIHDPASWPMQAKMAYEGHWEQLAEWQEKHRAGKY
ncbi:hypothetical protein [Flagellimonas zhangzhouensis]|uniref:Uncharacterized protein n=1 Tax=Flagellimonas zhangzhouensis TaxID=1073328 RepID=A0A1H2V412_9FLAO|nr:hypothetical protein [Allomuricauda zhangzhouensis]SDQ11069.1 hypothetical protein SAMN05216294_0388 [Allomuricauda zhangzhouensis]SDW63048.1 hypothetical protein SAMN04487892_1903 [Allomuricauda zhangzhouensis]